MSDTSTEATGTTPIEAVEGFIAALERLDLEGARTYLAPEIAYQNVPFPAVHGPDATIRLLRYFLAGGAGFEVEMHNIASDGDTVLTERTDAFSNGRFHAGFWVCGTFEVRNGQIAVWRDRFDFLDVGWNLLKGLVMIPFRRGG